MTSSQEPLKTKQWRGVSMQQRNSGKAMIENEYLNVLKCLGKRIKELRKERGLSLRQMEIIHGYRHSDWRRLESVGVDNMALLLKVAKGFEISLSALLDGLEQCSTGEGRRRVKNEVQHTHVCKGAPN